MTELEWLKDQSGLTDDELKTYETILGNGKFQAMLKKVIISNETLTTERETARGELEQFTTRYNNEFVPAMRTTAQEAINTAGELAALRAKLAKATEYGIVTEEKPAGNVEAPRAPGSPNPNGLTRDDLNQFSRAQSNTLISLQNLNAEHFELFGKPLGGTDELVAETERQRLLGNKNFSIRNAWEAKHNVPAKRAEAVKAERQKDIDAAVTADRKVQAERHGSNPNVRSGQTSKYDKYKASDASADGKKPWQAAHGHRQRNESWRGVALDKVRTASSA